MQALSMTDADMNCVVCDNGESNLHACTLCSSPVDKAGQQLESGEATPPG